MAFVCESLPFLLSRSIGFIFVGFCRLSGTVEARGNGLGHQGTHDHMTRIRDENGSCFSAARHVDGAALFLCILHQTLDRLGLGRHHRNDARGGWHGENTDGLGFARAAEMQLGIKLTGTQVILLGAGGAARAIAATALAQNCASLTIVNRSRERAETLARALTQFGIPNTECRIFSPDEIGNPEFEICNSRVSALVVNATALGLKPDDPSPFPPELLQAGMAVYDTTYGTHTSALVAAARKRNLPAADGRSMLAWQGALAFERWTSVPAAETFPVMFRELS